MMLLSCCGSTDYKLSGSTHDKNIEGKTVYLTHALDRSVKYDSAVVRNGSFQFKGKIALPEVRELYVEVDHSPYNYLPVVLEPGVIKIVLDTIVYTGNTPHNDRMQDFLIAKSNFVDENIRQDSISETFLSKFSFFLKQEILKNSDNLIGKYLYKAYSTKLTNEDKKDIVKRANISLVEEIQKDK